MKRVLPAFWWNEDFTVEARFPKDRASLAQEKRNMVLADYNPFFDYPDVLVFSPRDDVEYPPHLP